MAVFKAPADFINENVSLLAQRQTSMYSAFLESKPTYTTYYHINKLLTRTDKGLKAPEKLSGIRSPIRYNKILNFPLYGIDQIQLQLDEDEEGLTSDYTGEAIILPNTIHPTVDDYFIITYLEKKYMFRVTKYEYDTIKSNNYYKIEYSLQSVDIDFFEDIEKQVVKTYHTKLESIGTDDKVFITDEELGYQGEIISLYDSLAKDYLDSYFEPLRDPYNTLLFMQASTSWQCDYDAIFDQNLVHFCNSNKLFYKHDTTDAIYFYEEPRKYFHMEYSNSLYDLVEHDETDRIEEIHRYFDLEPSSSMDSIFMYYRDKRVKYLKLHKGKTNFFNGPTSVYVPEGLVTAIKSKDLTALDPIDKLIAYYLLDPSNAEQLMDLMRVIKPRHLRYSFKNFILIPIVLFVLAAMYNYYNESEIDSLDYELANEMSLENI